MITLTLAAPGNDQAIGAGYDHLQVLACRGSSAGPFAAIGAVSLVLGTTSYSYTDFSGAPGDWYEAQYLTAGTGAVTPPYGLTPGYFTTLANSIRDLLGVSTNEITDTQLQDLGFVPQATAQLRTRIATFDSLIATGGDPATLALGALAHYTAALLCPRMTMMIMDQERFKDYQYIRNRNLDWTATATALMARYEILASQAAGETYTNLASYASPLALAGPSRAGEDNPGLVPFTPDPFENPLVPYTNTLPT